MAQNNITGVTTVNSGYPGKAVTDWLASYLATDLAQSPDVYIVRWGINDANNGQTVYQFITNLRQGLATIRASRSLNSLSIILMPPSAIDLSTYPGGYTAWCNWAQQVNPLIRQAARDYECCFIDIYPMFEDAANGGDWLAADLVHPLNVANVWINDITFKTLFPNYFCNPPTSSGSIGALQSPQYVTSFFNSWSDYGGVGGSLNYFKDQCGIVHLEGALKGGSEPYAAFTLPAGYRPASMRCFTTAGATNIQVRNDGTVWVCGGSNAWIPVDGITFRAYQ